jgi:hypothetical protein
MGLDRRDRREELRRDLAIRLPRRDKGGNLAFRVRQPAIAPGPGPRPPQLLLGALCPQARSQACEDRGRRLELLGCAPPLAVSAERLAGDE